MVKWIVDNHGLRPTRRSQRTESACSIVAQALERAKMAMSESAVEKIWQKSPRRPKN
jgi:hypothetical protein